MVKKNYNWRGGATLDFHTEKKHTILSDYFRQYLLTRCQLPQMEKFRLVIVDGFSGGGVYKCGSFGSPLIFPDTLNKTLNEINIKRVSEGLKPIPIDCLLLLNDNCQETLLELKENIAPLLAGIKDENHSLSLNVEYSSSKFEEAYPQIKSRVQETKCGNVFFNLDQCGYSLVPTAIIRDIMLSWGKAEIILTFMIKSLLTYISPDQKANSVPLEPQLQETVNAILKDPEKLTSKPEWLGKVEQVTFNYLHKCAPYVSPFSINNPDGWRYWLMHFANSYRARQVYNDILHDNANAQAHFGRAGLNMLSFNPQEEGLLYMFDTPSRTVAKNELYDDIPRKIAEFGDTLGVGDFYQAAYNETPAHSDDIHEMIIANPDVEVITESGGERRKPNTIKPSDTLKLKAQKTMFSMFLDN